MSENEAAEPEYATAKIAVWWDMKDCPVPEGYDARRVRPSLEAAFKKLGYSGPVSITAYADHKQTPGHLLRRLSSTGIAIAHSITQNTCSKMFSDILKWRGRNPPPATMMVISDLLEDVLAWDLARLQQVTYYNLFRASSFRSFYVSVLLSSAKWVWDSLLGSAEETGSAFVLRRCSQLSASELSTGMFYCKSCSFDCQSLASFRKHLSSSKHILEEIGNSGNGQLDPVTRTWGKNYDAKPEYATAQIAVWWDMIDCPIPEDYDARHVRGSIEAAFKKLGYSGPVSITAFGDLKDTPDHVLRELSSTGVSIAHSIPERIHSRMCSDMICWVIDNRPPATMMVISNHVEAHFSGCLVKLQQRHKYNLFLAYSFRPYKMSILVTSAEWLWDTLLAGVSFSFATVSYTRRPLLQKCNEMCESTGKFFCESCCCECKDLDDFSKHLSSKEHVQQEASMYSRMQLYKRKREQRIKVLYCTKSKCFRKAPRSGFRPFHNHLSLTNRMKISNLQERVVLLE